VVKETGVTERTSSVSASLASTTSLATRLPSVCVALGQYGERNCRDGGVV
jgi:hypothetical protein